MSGLCGEFRARCPDLLFLDDDGIHAVRGSATRFHAQCPDIHAGITNVAFDKMRAHVQGTFEREATCSGCTFFGASRKCLKLDAQ